jgi:hypothetical protein
VSGHLRTDCESFPELETRLGSLLYRAGDKGGIIPYNIGTLAVGRFDAVAFGDGRAEAELLWERARECVRGPR